MSMVDEAAKRFAGGRKFKSGNKTGGFDRKLKDAVIETSSFGSLRDNRDTVGKVIKEYEKYIRGEEVTKSMEEKIIREIKKSDSSLTNTDIKGIKAIVEQLSKKSSIETVEKKKTSASTKRADTKRDELRPPPDFLRKGSVSVNKNPWSRSSTGIGGSGGGIASGSNQGRFTSRPKLK